MRLMRAHALWIGGWLAVSATGCEQISGISSLSVGASATADASVSGRDGASALDVDGVAAEDASCTDPSGFNGRGCFHCSPTETIELLNACTSAACTPFDNGARIRGNLADAAPRTPTLAPVVPPSPSPEGGIAPSGAGDAGAPGHVKCADLSPRPVYLYGSSALNIGLRTLAQAISATATIVYQNDASCAGLDSILTGVTRIKGSAQYWPAMQELPQPCDIDGEQSADIGLCDVSPESCIGGFTGSPNLVNDTGAAQVFMFTVPKAPSQKTISAEAAYAVFGFDDGAVSPWDDPASLVRRGAGSGNQLTIASSLGLAPEYWRGVIKARSSEVKPALLALPDPEKGLAITSADVADEMDSRANLRTLGYQHYGQGCAFTPDSSTGSSDKRNVRDGHYELWAPLHFYTRGANGRTQDAFIAEIVSFLTGAKPLPNRNTDLITTLKQAGLVPTCAMRVSRAKEGARIVPFQPAPSCSCYYDASPPGGSVTPNCKTCTTNADCSEATPNCSFGFCEP